MHIHLCIGLLESREGPFLGLREFIDRQVLPRFGGTSVWYHHWRDDVAREVARTRAKGAGPLILLGHSYGASALFRAARRLPAVAIDHLILLDPVPRWLWGQFQWSCYRLPPNVRAATCFYNPVSLPKSSPIRNVESGKYRNVTVTPWHASIPGDAEVQSAVLEILAAEHKASLGRGGGGRGEAVKVPPVVVRGL